MEIIGIFFYPLLSQSYSGGQFLKYAPCLFILIIPLLFNCQVGFFFRSLDEAEYIRDAADPDRDLILRMDSLRRAHLNGELSESDGLRVFSSVKYVIQAEDNKLYITFFGTDSAEDVYYGMTHWQEPFWTEVNPQIRVHGGFHRPFQTIAPDILISVENFIATTPADRRIFIQGHSGGGAHAVFCSFFLAREIPDALPPGGIYCVTAGTPAPGNKTFAEVFNSEPGITLHRYVNGSDMMPSILSEEMGFFHVGQAYHIGPDPNPLAAATGLWIADHYLDAYGDSLR